MGLDMYLTKEIYFHDRENDENKVEVKYRGIAIPDVKSVRIEAMYWRKANAIHAWFVDECQEGTDDCKEYEVDIDHLKALLKIVRAELKEKAEGGTGELESREGFFFGSTDRDEWFWDNLKRTRKELVALIRQHNKDLREFKDGVWISYYYRSSW